MLNCPAAYRSREPSVASRWSVTTSAVSSRRPTTRWLTGVMPAGGRESAWVGRAIEIQNPHARGVEAIAEDGGDALREVEAERGVCGALASQADGVEDNRMDVVERVGVEMPAIGRKEPRPPEDITGVERVDRHHAPTGGGDAERHPAGAQGPEGVGMSSFADDRSAFLDHHVASAPGHDFEVRVVHSREETMRGQLIGDRVHADAPGRPSPALIAAASSVISMPTGHHVMQRPHPTQPEVPNWSHQVPSL